MDPELRRLVEDPGFLKFHAETAKSRKFNPFNVLRYADYEIRHSNVLAWLLLPNETHGIGDVFVREFMNLLNHEAVRAGNRPIPVPSSFEADNIRVERELDYVDITIFFECEKLLVAIENKTEERSPEHAKQVNEYEQKLRKKYEGQYDVHSVLLTMSGDEGASGQAFIHASWSRVREIVSSIHERERFDYDDGDKVRAFIGHYLEVVGQLTTPPESDRHYFNKLLDDHRTVLRRLLKEREDGAARVDRVLADDSSEYARTIARLLTDFRQEPKRLRGHVKRFLDDRDFRTWIASPAGYSSYYLYFSNPSMEADEKAAECGVASQVGAHLYAP